MKKLFIQNTSWIQDVFSAQTNWLGVPCVIVFFIGNMVVENFAYDVIELMHPEYAYESAEFFLFLQSNPWEYIVIKSIWILILYLCFFLMGLKFFSVKKESREHFVFLFLSALVIFSLQLISFFVNKTNGTEVSNQELLNNQIINSSWIKVFIIYVLIPAFSEELITRGIIMRYILPAYPYIGMVISALLFESMHYTTNIYEYILFFLSGLGYAFVYFKTGRLKYCIYLHGFNNLVALMLIKFSG